MSSYGKITKQELGSVLNKELDRISIQVSSSGEDDTQNLINAVSVAKERHSGKVFLPDKRYSLKLDLEIDDVEIYGSSDTLIVPFNGTNTTLSIKGNHNKVHDLKFESSGSNYNPVVIDGNDNVIENVTVNRLEKLDVNSMYYNRNGITIRGNRNIVTKCHVFNMFTGINTNGGFNSKILYNHIHDNLTGIRCSASAKNVEISHNIISDNNVHTGSGCDGILCTRNTSNYWIHHNLIEGSGEHGLYFQGDHSIIENNTVINNHRSGIKLASYNTGLSGWNNDDPYIGKNNKITGNVCYGNAFDGSNNAAIYLQSPLMNIDVSNNIISDENGFGIRSVLMAIEPDSESGTPYQIIDNITVENNRISNSSERDISITCVRGLRILNNVCSENLGLLGNSTLYTQSGLVEGNEFENVTISNCRNIILRNNVARSNFGATSNSRDIHAYNNTIHIRGSSSLYLNEFKHFNDNQVTLHDESFMGGRTGVNMNIDEFKGNTIERVADDSSEQRYVINAPWNGETRDGIISNNTFIYPDGDRGVRLFAQRCTIQNNVFKGESGRCLELYSGDSFIEGNSSANMNGRIYCHDRDGNNRIINNSTLLYVQGNGEIVVNNYPDWLSS